MTNTLIARARAAADAIPGVDGAMKRDRIALALHNHMGRPNDSRLAAALELAIADGLERAAFNAHGSFSPEFSAAHEVSVQARKRAA